MYRLCKITSYAYIREGSNLKECMTSKLHKVQFLFILISAKLLLRIVWNLQYTDLQKYAYLYLSKKKKKKKKKKVERLKQFLIIKPTRCINFSNLLLEWNSTCFRQFLCPSSGVFHCTHSNSNSDIYNINTRTKSNLHQPIANLSKYQKGAYYSGIKVYNSLPTWIKDLSADRKQFGHALKSFFTHTHFIPWTNTLKNAISVNN